MPGDGGAQVTNPDAAAVPLQPWARAVLNHRRVNQLEPHTRCKPSGGIRQFLTPYGVEFVEFKDLQRIYIFDIGGPHTFHTIYMDGRSHPADFTPTYYGHSIGWWEGDTLVVETKNIHPIQERSGAVPISETGKVTERFTRVSDKEIFYEYTVEDPKYYSQAWKGEMVLNRSKEPVYEYACHEGNYALHGILAGARVLEAAGRTVARNAEVER